MKPFPITADTPTDVAQFNVDWSQLVTAVIPLAESEHPYLAAIAKYTNLVRDELEAGNTEIVGGSFAFALTLAKDPEFERLLGLAHHRSVLQPGLAGSVIARTAVANALHGFAPDAPSLALRVEQARFEYLSPLFLEATLAQDLYLYGMYRFFYQDHSANEARAIAHQFVTATLGDELENFVPFTTRLPWADWFDPHSCSDRSWLLFERTAPRAWLLGFSHSD